MHLPDIVQSKEFSSPVSCWHVTLKTMFDHGVSDQLTPGLIGDSGQCERILLNVSSQRTNNNLPGVLRLILKVSAITRGFNPAQIICPCNPSLSYSMQAGKDKCLLRIRELLNISHFRLLFWAANLYVLADFTNGATWGITLSPSVSRSTEVGNNSLISFPRNSPTNRADVSGAAKVQASSTVTERYKT